MASSLDYTRIKQKFLNIEKQNENDTYTIPQTILIKFE